MKKSALYGLVCLVCIAVVSGVVKFQKKEQQELKIGVSLYTEHDTFVETIVSAMQAKAMTYEQESGIAITLNISYANGSQREQNRQIQQYIELGYDAICVNVVDRTDASVMIDLAKEAGLPLIFFNREPVREDLFRAKDVYYVGTDARETAIKQGEAVVQSYMIEPQFIDKNGDGILQYVMLEGEMGHQDTILRSDYVLQTIEESGIVLEKLDTQTADWLRIRADEITEQWLQKFGNDIELILCNNDDMALGAADAIARAGKHIAIFGIDGTLEGIEAVTQERIFATVDCHARQQGEAVFDIAYAFGCQKPLPKNISYYDERYIRIPVSVYTKN